MLKWDSNRELNETYYMLTCLKELTTGKPGQQGLYGGAGNPDVIQNQQISTAQQKVITQERQNRLEIQKNILAKGGFQFLIHVFNSVNKETDYEQDILTSKTLQLLIFLLNQLHQSKLQQQMQTIEKHFHVKVMIEGALAIVHQFLLNVIKKQTELKEQLEAKQDHQFVSIQLQNQPIETMILTASLNFLTKILTVCPNSWVYIQKSDKLYHIIKLGLIDSTQKKIQEKICIFSNNLSTKIETFVVKLNQDIILPSFFITEMCIKEFIPLSLLQENTQKMRMLYKMLNQIFTETDVYKSLNKIQQPGVIVTNIVKIIQEREIKEGSSRDEDVVIGGLFEFLG